MTSQFDPVLHNRDAWDREVEAGNEWTVPVSSEVIERARRGDWQTVLIDRQPVPREWFPPDVHGLRVLCLASGGGQQGPVLAAAGCKVTVFDNSPRQLEQDRVVAARDGLDLATVLGDMRDLRAFEDESFDLVFNPVSSVFCPDVGPVWREAFRVLRPGGLLLCGFMNPDVFIFDTEALDKRGEFVVRHSLPYSDLESLSPEEREHLFGRDAPVEYSHTLSDQIGGQLSAGFLITAFDEARDHRGPTARYLPYYFATRSIKPAS